MQDLVSIIMPAYNCANYVENSVLSVMQQTYLNWELIIIDDCSTDNTRAVITKLAEADKRIKPLLKSKNGGVARARNSGLDQATGKYIAFLDSDDLWKPHKLDQQLQFMKETGCKFCFSRYEIIDKDNNKTAEIRQVPDRLDYSRLLNTNPIGCLTVILEADLMSDIRMPLIKHEDYATWLTILQKNEIVACGMPEILASYRKHANSTSANKLKALSWTWRIYRENRGMNLPRASWQMLKYLYFTIAKYLQLKR